MNERNVFKNLIKAIVFIFTFWSKVKVAKVAVKVREASLKLNVITFRTYLKIYNMNKKI